jgi:hypothetical protein
MEAARELRKCGLPAKTKCDDILESNDYSYKSVGVVKFPLSSGGQS